MAKDKKIKVKGEAPIFKEQTKRHPAKVRHKSRSVDTQNARAWSKMDPVLRKLSQAILRFGIKGKSLNNFSHSFTPRMLDKSEEES